MIENFEPAIDVRTWLELKLGREERVLTDLDEDSSN